MNAAEELREKRNDLLDIRGLLSPNGGPEVVPMELGETVAPAVKWLIGDRDRLRDELTDARHELDVLRGLYTDLNQRYDQVLGELAEVRRRLDLATAAGRKALDERDQALAEHEGCEDNYSDLRAKLSTTEADLDEALDRSMAKARIHPALHDLNVRIVALSKGHCHCNLIAEVVLDAWLGAEEVTGDGGGD